MNKLKKILTGLVILCLMISILPANTLAVNDDITIRIHYHRPDGDYQDWELWAWDEDGNYSISGSLSTNGSATDAPPYKFEQGNNEMICTITVPTGTMRIGYIVRQPSWTAKDVEHDQFINLTGILSGTVDFYIESGVPSQPSKEALPTMEELCAKTIQYNGKTQNIMVLGDDVVIGSVVTAADYDFDKNGNPLVKVMLSSDPGYPVTLDTFTITGAYNIIAAEVTKIAQIGTAYYLYLDQQLPLDEAFNIEFEGQQYAITLPDYYSTKEFEERYTYEGNDLGQTYTKEKTTLKVWAPLAASVQVRLYEDGDPAKQEYPDAVIDMVAGEKGTWSVELHGNYNGTYYTYYVDNVSEQKECVDPYARAVGVNGRRSMIIDLASTDPAGWASDRDPHYDDAITDAIIWELHVRDLTSDASSGVKEAWRGKYLGLIQSGTTNTYGQATGLDYIKNLGITHIQLLPVYDFGSVDEKKDTGFNWGYDPMNYNVPEGSYSTDPYNGEVRVKEFKQMVKGLHDNGISVIMDVVYNHVYDANQFCFNNTVPNYFSRPGSNGSGCGNDTASERSMVRKYIVDSVNYWVDEYHIDGFRFDLAGLIDTDTINEIVDTVQEKHPNVIFYGEGWSISTITTKPAVTMATQYNSTKTPNFAYFSDSIRTTLKGNTYGDITGGYISGASVSTSEMSKLFKGMPDWCTTPTQSINYLSCHDNHTLFDHITIANPSSNTAERVAMNNLGAAFYLAAQGIPFMQAGEEMLRSKPDSSKEYGYNPNSYNAPDQVNSIKWDNLQNGYVSRTMAYYQGLIAFRKAHPALRMTNASQVQSNITNLSGLDDNVLGYIISGNVSGETADGIIAIFNPNESGTTVELPAGQWHICVNKDSAGVTSLGIVSDSVYVEEISAMFLVKSDTVPCSHPSHGTDGYCTVCQGFVGHSYGDNEYCVCGEKAADITDPTQGQDIKPGKDDEDEADSSQSGSVFDLIDPVTLIAIILLSVGVIAIAIIVIILVKRKKG